jgi:uncharacterized membrane protein YoaK (UPF0700 family)
MTRTGGTLSLILAFLSGYVDTAVFVHMKGLFVAHVTGNFVLLGTAVTDFGVGNGLEQSAWLKLMAFAVFFVAAGFAAVIAGWVAPTRRTSFLLWLAAGLIGGAGLAALTPFQIDPFLAMVLVCGMAVLNAAQRLDSTLGPPFTVMTGNVTSVAIEAARRLRLAPRDEGSASGMTAITMLILVVGFALGCAVGATSQLVAGLAAMILPAALLCLHLVRR